MAVVASIVSKETPWAGCVGLYEEYDLHCPGSLRFDSASSVNEDTDQMGKNAQDNCKEAFGLQSSNRNEGRRRMLRKNVTVTPLCTADAPETPTRCES
eukprot:scaffold606970_cov46-Prasinocladus_malaysianus.AAC.1